MWLRGCVCHELLLRGGGGQGCDRLSRQRSDERGRFSPLPRLKARRCHLLSPSHSMNGLCFIKHACELGEWEREEGRETVCTLVHINLDFFFNLAAWHFPMLKGSQILTHIFLLTIFLHRKVLLSANNWLQCISFSKINITQLIYKQHDAFKLRDGWQGQQVRALAKTYLTPCDCFADPRGRLPTFLTQPHYQSTDSNAHQVCLCLLHPNPRTSGLSDRGGRRCAGSLCTK